MVTVRIVIIGPESTGKSTLTKQLAAHYNAPYVEEFARTYLEARKESSYEWKDLEAIARGQMARIEEAMTKAPKLLFCDTDLVTLHIWSLDKFDKPIPFVESLLAQHKPHLYLLCKPDIAWQPDPLREDATRRVALFSWNAWVLESINANYQMVGGTGDARFKNALSHVNRLLTTR